MIFCVRCCGPYTLRLQSDAVKILKVHRAGGAVGGRVGQRDGERAGRRRARGRGVRNRKVTEAYEIGR